MECTKNKCSKCSGQGCSCSGESWTDVLLFAFFFAPFICGIVMAIGEILDSICYAIFEVYFLDVAPVILAIFPALVFLSKLFEYFREQDKRVKDSIKFWLMMSFHFMVVAILAMLYMKKSHDDFGGSLPEQLRSKQIMVRGDSDDK